MKLPSIYRMASDLVYEIAGTRLYMFMAEQHGADKQNRIAQYGSR
jgi:hypothetical protein